MATENNDVTQEQLDQEHAKLVGYQETPRSEGLWGRNDVGRLGNP